MEVLVEISPAKGDGYCLRFREFTHWFALESQAISYAQDIYPDAEIVLFDADMREKHHYAARKTRRAVE